MYVEKASKIFLQVTREIIYVVIGTLKVYNLVYIYIYRNIEVSCPKNDCKII